LELSEFNSTISDINDQTIRFTKSTYISGNEIAYRQAIYSESDDEPNFVGLSTGSFPTEYKRPDDLYLELYNEFVNKPHPVAYNIVLQRVSIHDQFTDYNRDLSVLTVLLS